MIGKAPDPAARRAYEEALSRRLAAIGVRAEPSYHSAPEPLGPEAIARAVARGGQDGLIAARLVGVDQRIRYLPGAPGSVAWRHSGWRTWDGFEPGKVVTSRVARIETEVWSLAGEGAIVWAGASEVVNPRGIASVADSLAEATVRELQRAGVLPGD